MLDKLKSMFSDSTEETQSVEVNLIDATVAQKLGLTLPDGFYKTADINRETGEVVFTDIPSITPPEFSSDRFLVNAMADFANANEVVLPKWTADPLKIARAIADWQA
ncbi:hypothetical protein MCCARTNEY_128 [Bacillus phage vB_BanH_McCartney]|nr:hypothetical protein MCCARTNEY_128 [Bacillus phage vB_BanH_McCartney]